VNTLGRAMVKSRKAHIKLCKDAKHDIPSLYLLAKMDRYIILLEETVDNLSDPEENPYD